MIILEVGNKMLTEISCPNCRQPINPQNRNCEHCGIDLAVAAAIVERMVAIPSKLPDNLPITPEALVPRIGEYLIEQGLLNQVDLSQGLQYQKDRASEGKPLLLGQALLELKLVNHETLDRIVTMQILTLHNVLNTANQQLTQRVQERTAELQKALEHLSDINQLKSNFIANISHELRTPLTHIKGYLDLISEGNFGPLTISQVDAISVIQRAEARLELLIENLIQFSLASSGEINLNLNEVYIDKLIQFLVESSYKAAKVKNIDLRIISSDSLPPVQADEEKISWVITHLIDNAIKFTPPGGCVGIKAGRVDQSLVISVMDSGIGIPQDRINEIFEPFHQLDTSSTRRYGGTGLGLAIVKRILEAHSSDITVESKVGEGSKFEFSLPIASNTSN
jgi:signal transduction histidine kinase